MDIKSLTKAHVDIAEHSICQPGRPKPQGESQPGSPSLAAFHKAKSLGSFLLSSTIYTAPAINSSGFYGESLP